MKGNKTSGKDVDAYIKRFPKAQQDILKKIRETIRKALPKAEEAISYQIPVFKVNGKYVVYFSGWKKHVSLYPIPTGTPVFKKEIAPYVAGRGTIKFLLDKPIPYNLVKKVAKYRLEDSLKGRKVPSR